MHDDHESGGRLWSFRYADLPLRGGLVQLGPEWRAWVAERGYAPLAAQLLGESLCAVALLAGSAKNPPRLTLQLSGAAGVDLLVAQSLRTGQLRGMVKPAHLAALPFGQGGRLVMTLEPMQSRDDTTVAQSIVALDGASLAQAMAGYFQQSEQLLTAFYFHADAHNAFGLMVQRIAGDATDVSAALDVVDQWALRDLPPAPEQYLAALLEHDIVLLEPVQHWQLACHCDSGTVGRMLLGLGHDDARALIRERGQIDIECGYCGASYRYDPAQVEQLFAAADTPPPDAPLN